MFSPFRRRWAMRLAERPRMSPLTSTTVGAGPEGTFFALAGAAADFQVIGPFAVVHADFGWIAGFGVELVPPDAASGAFGGLEATGFFTGLAGTTDSGVAGAVGGTGAAGVSSAKESNPLTVGLGLEELFNAQGGAARRLDLEAGRLGVVQRRDGEGFCQTALGEELSWDEDRLLRLG